MVPKAKTRGFQFYCPICSAEQRAPVPKRLQAREYAQIFLATTVSAILLFPFLAWKGLSIGLFFWAIYEFVLRMRKRYRLVCRKCGFDPFLYRYDREQARAQVKSRIQEQILGDERLRGKRLKNYRAPTTPDTANTSAEESDTADLVVPADAAAAAVKSGQRPDLTR